MDAHYLVEMAWLQLQVELGLRIPRAARRELERHLAYLERAASVSAHVEGLRRLSEAELDFGD